MLDRWRLFSFNVSLVAGQVAQSVEQWTENPRVGGSIPPLATIPFRSIPKTWVIPGLSFAFHILLINYKF
jgi:hypothetical protein